MSLFTGWLELRHKLLTKKTEAEKPQEAAVQACRCITGDSHCGQSRRGKSNKRRPGGDEQMEVCTEPQEPRWWSPWDQHLGSYNHQQNKILTPSVNGTALLGVGHTGSQGSRSSPGDKGQSGQCAQFRSAAGLPQHTGDPDSAQSPSKWRPGSLCSQVAPGGSSQGRTRPWAPGHLILIPIAPTLSRREPLPPGSQGSPRNKRRSMSSDSPKP